MKSHTLVNSVLNRLPILGIIHLRALPKGAVCPKLNIYLTKESEPSY